LKLKKDLVDLKFQKYGLASSEFIEFSSSEFSERVMRGKELPSSLITVDEEAEICILFTNSIDDSMPIVDVNSINNLGGRLEERKMFNMSYDMASFDAKAGVSFARKFAKVLEMTDEKDNGIELDPFLADIDNEWIDEIDVKAKDFIETDLFVVPGLEETHHAVLLTTKFFSRNPHLYNHLISLKECLNQIDLSTGVTVVDNTIRQSMDSMSRWDTVRNIMTSSSTIDINDEIRRAWDNSSERVKFNFLDERKLNMMSTLGEFFITGFKSAEISSSFEAEKAKTLKVNYRDPNQVSLMEEFIRETDLISDDDVDIITDQELIGIYRLKLSLHHISRITGTNLEPEPSTKSRFSPRRMKNTLDQLNIKL